jgi:hypothetical protein
MQDSPNFHYLTPLLFPLFPTCGGQLRVGLDLQKVLNIRAVPGFDGSLRVSYGVYLDGRLTAQEAVETRVAVGTVETAYLWRDYPAERMGYVEVAITADSPVFRRIDLPVGYAVLGVPGFGSLTVIPDAKFARPIIVEQMQATKAFCLVHSASHWDSAADSGNSLLFVNPYEQDIVATVQASGDRKARQRVRAKEAVFVPVNRILADGEWSCTMVTANNRIPAWDVRHRASDARYVNRIDHLDVFRGNRTHADLGLPQVAKLYARRAMRRVGKVF